MKEWPISKADYNALRAEIEKAVEGAYSEGYHAGEKDGRDEVQREYSRYQTKRILGENAVAKIIGKETNADD